MNTLSTSPTTNTSIRVHRLVLVYILVLAWTLGIAARLVYLQGFQAEKYRTLAAEQQSGYLEISSRRGEIRDRRLEDLAISIRADSLYAQPTQIKKVLEAAQSLGITNAIGLLARAYRAWRHDPAPNDAVVARGEAYLARHPDADDRDDVHARLATAYERAERYDRALLHVRAMRTPDLDEVEDLEDKLADQMLERARRSDADPALLAAVATHFPSTDAAETARTALEKRIAHGDLTLSREQASLVVVSESSVEVNIQIPDELVPPQIQEAALAARTVYIRVEKANTRSCPQSSCGVVDQLSQGTPIQIEAVVEGEVVDGDDRWYRISLGEAATAYIHRSLTSPLAP